MKKILLIIAVLFLAVFCFNIMLVHAQSKSTMVGAYTKIPVTDPAVKQCQTLIQKYFDKLKMNVKLVKVTDAYSQVVAGVNYKIIGAVNNNAKTENWQFIIYKDLKQNMRVTSAQNLTK